MLAIKLSWLFIPLAVAAKDQQVAVRVGDFQRTPQQVQEAMLQLPQFQLQALGNTPAEIREAYVHEYLVPELLLTLEAKRRELDDTQAFRARRDDLMMRALVEQLRAELVAKSPVTKKQLQSYYEKHRDQFVTPRRIHIWRIAVAERSLAERILRDVRQAKVEEQIQLWSKLAREHSLDKATYLRNGDVGMVRPNGHTDVPRVRVPQELFVAAEKAQDGELVSAPVNVGERYAVLWRRGSLPELRRELEEVRGHIETVLLRQSLTETLDKLVQRLRAQHVKEGKPELVTTVEFEPGIAKVTVSQPAPSARTPLRGAPQSGDDGLR